MNKQHNPNTQHNIGTYLAELLEAIGLEHYFTVPGDYNLVLLDQMLKNPNLKMIGCCNELNAGYSADGYARARGVAAVFPTFTVGSLSMVNAIAGAYAEDLPIIVISGEPNSNAPLNNRGIREYVQAILTEDSALLVETGYSWFNGQKLQLPDGCLYEFQENSTSFVMTNIQATRSKMKKQIGNLYGLRTWVKYGFRQCKQELGWADYRFTNFKEIDKWWEIIFSAYWMISFHDKVFCNLN